MKKAALAIGLVLAVVAALWMMGRQPPPQVSLHTVTRGLVEKTVSNTRAGTVEACRRSKLSMPIGGRVDKLHVDEGDQVEAGQVLLALWNLDRKAMQAQSEAQLLAARSRSEKACVESANAAREARRLETLLEKKLASREAAELGRTRAQGSQFACQAARDEEKFAQANLEMNQALLEETYLRAPFGGIVAQINGEVGEYVTPSPPGVATPPAIDLIDYGCLYVNAPIDEVDAGELERGLPARVTLDAFRGETFAATLDRIAPYVLDLEKQARTVEIDVKFTDPAVRSRLLVGYSADIDIILETQNDVLRVPTEAVLENDEVFRYNAASGKLERVAIGSGLRNWNFTEVTQNLQAGDRIVLSLDVAGLDDGVAVTPADD
ncbi:MAG: efflux RND transporter periplasmic adaptor subunit [Gammaproteobacteria bacterium]|nr:efflux RND transporter periplasmic adaptor subunit [Gammaproteobacteria bacterium]